LNTLKQYSITSTASIDKCNYLEEAYFIKVFYKKNKIFVIATLPGVIKNHC